MRASDDLVAVLLTAIGGPPSKVGLRLKPEEDLAKLLGVGRRRVRNALSALEQQGFISRRRGSGSYVRRVPEGNTAPDLTRHTSLQNKPLLSSESFFADVADGSNRRLQVAGPNPSQQVLHLQLWKDLHSSPTVGQAIVDGILARANDLSHHLTVHSFFLRKDRLLTAEELRQKILTGTCDGYIVASRWSDLFMDAMGRATLPVVFYSSSKRLISHEPHLMLDTAEAIERGVRILGQQGHKRIAVLAIAATGHVGYLDTDAYSQTMANLSLTYRAFASSERDVNASIETTIELLTRHDRPDALYVSDNFLLDGVVAALKMKSLVPGRDIAIITHGNVEHELPPGFDWSRIEFDLHAFGHRLVDELLCRIQRADVQQGSLSVFGRWRPGDTHLSCS